MSAHVPVIDRVVHGLYWALEHGSSGWHLYEAFTLLKFSYAWPIITACNSINAALGVYNSNISKPRLYWLHSMVLVLCAGCGGGIMAAGLQGRPASLIANEILVPLMITAWYLTHYLGMAPFFQFVPIRLVWSCFMCLYRTHSVIDSVNVATSVLKASVYYPIPFTGPIIVGIMTGGFGAFVPYDKGLAPIANGTPWPLQGAFLTAFLYHSIVNDKTGFIGTSMRAILGTHSDATMRTAIASLHIVTVSAQVLFHPDANLFTPLHKIGYLVFQLVQPVGANSKKAELDTVGWDYRSRVHLRWLLELSRVVMILAVVLGRVYYLAPPSVIPAGADFHVNDIIGSCQLLSSVQKCQPTILTLEVPPASIAKPDYLVRLATYKGAGKTFTPLPEVDTPLWTLPMKSPSSWTKVPKDADKLMVLDETSGTVRVVARSQSLKQDIVLWTSSAACQHSASDANGEESTSLSSGVVFVNLDGEGRPQVTCADGSTLPLV